MQIVLFFALASQPYSHMHTLIHMLKAIQLHTPESWVNKAWDVKTPTVFVPGDKTLNIKIRTLQAVHQK